VTSNEDAVATGGNALPKDDRPNLTRFRSAAAKRLQAHGPGWGCGAEEQVRRLISNGHRSLESSEAAAASADTISLMRDFSVTT
jgi:hypothetical protein